MKTGQREFHRLHSELTREGFKDACAQDDASLFVIEDKVVFHRQNHVDLFSSLSVGPVENELEVRILAPSRSADILKSHEKNKDASARFWQMALGKSIDVKAITADFTPLDEYRANNSEKLPLPAYLALRFGMGGDDRMLKFYAEVTPSVFVSLASLYPDLLV